MASSNHGQKFTNKCQCLSESRPDATRRPPVSGSELRDRLARLEGLNDPRLSQALVNLIHAGLGLELSFFPPSSDQAMSLEAGAKYAKMRKADFRRACVSGEIHAQMMKRGKTVRWKILREDIDKYLCRWSCA